MQETIDIKTVEEINFLEKRKVSEWWEKRVWNKDMSPKYVDKGIGVATEHGILGYGIPAADDSEEPVFIPLVFSSLSRAEGLCKVLRNRTAMEHVCVPIRCKKALGLSAFVRVRDVEPTTIPPDGRASRFAQSRVTRKRREEAKKAQIAEFMGEKKSD